MRPLNRFFLTLILLIPGLAIASNGDALNTLATNKAVPSKLIPSVMAPEMATKFLNAPYSGFYQIQGKVKGNKMKFDKVKTKVSFPDASLEPLALGLTSLLDLPVYSTGSRIKTRATAYVAFYSDQPEQLGIDNAITVPTSVDKDPNTTVLVIIKQKETSSARNPNMQLSNAELGKRDGSQAYFFQLAI